MVSRNAAALTALALVGSAPPAWAQTVEIEPIAYGETATNFLVGTDHFLGDSSLYKMYVFQGEEGDSVTILLSSADFNANLIVTDSDDNTVAADDNGGGDCNAYVTSILPASGQYVIYANAAAPGESGGFQLSLRKGMHPPNSRARCVGYVGHRGALNVGDRVEGSLGSGDRVLGGGSYFQVWLLPDIGGQVFTADLSSDAFDAQLMLVRGISEVVAVDDDGAGGCNARIVHAPADTRPLRIVVRSAGERQSGTFTLDVTQGAKPIVQQSECMRGS